MLRWTLFASSHTRFARSGITPYDHGLRSLPQRDSGNLFLDAPIALSTHCLVRIQRTPFRFKIGQRARYSPTRPPVACSASHLGQNYFGFWRASCCAGWRDHLAFVTPDTFVRWHRQGWRSFWRWKSRCPGGHPHSQRRGAGPDRDHVARQLIVGYRADQRRAAQAGHRGQQSLDSAL
jgi:hypothetical protein